jgi:hypothetical protein
MINMEEVPLDAEVEIVLRSIHPNLTAEPQTGPRYSTRYSELLTLVREFKVFVRVELLLKSKFFEEVLHQDPRILAERKAIEVRARQLKITARKNQVSIESILTCLDYLPSDNPEAVDVSSRQITPDTMLSVLVTSVFLKLKPLEDYVAKYIASQLTPATIVPTIKSAVQTGVKSLQHHCYVWVKQLILYRMGLMPRPTCLLSEDRNLEFTSPLLKYLGESVSLDVFKDKEQTSIEDTASYHVRTR